MFADSSQRVLGTGNQSEWVSSRLSTQLVLSGSRQPTSGMLRRYTFSTFPNWKLLRNDYSLYDRNTQNVGHVNFLYQLFSPKRKWPIAVTSSEYKALPFWIHKCKELLKGEAVEWVSSAKCGHLLPSCPQAPSNSHCSKSKPGGFLSKRLNICSPPVRKSDLHFTDTKGNVSQYFKRKGRET